MKLTQFAKRLIRQINTLNRIPSRNFNNFYKKRSIYSRTNNTNSPENSENNPNSTFQSDPLPPSPTPSPNEEIIYHEHPHDEFITPEKTKYRQNNDNELLKFKIYGEENHVAIVDLYPNSSIKSGSSKVVYMTNGVELESNVGGMMSGIKRMFTGSSLMMSHYTYSLPTGYGRVAFSEDLPSKIIPVRLSDYGGEIICQKGAFVCGTPDIEIKIETVKSAGIGLFGGEGFILQKITGGPNSTALIKAGGSLIKKRLRPGEKIKIRPGLIVMRECSVDYDIQYVGSIKNVFGAGSLFFATLTGPGDVYVQTMDIDAFISEVVSRVNKRDSTNGWDVVNSFVGKKGDDGNDK
jgi:uncharacterized protein (AIM24 family)